MTTNSENRCSTGTTVAFSLPSSIVGGGDNTIASEADSFSTTSYSLSSSSFSNDFYYEPDTIIDI